MRLTAALLVVVATTPGRADDDFREIKGHAGPVRVVRYTADGTKLVSCTGWPKGDETIRIWDVKTGRELKSITGFKKELDGMALSPDGKRALTGGHDNTGKIWDLEAGKLLNSLEGHTQQVPAVAFRPDGKMVATGSHDKAVKLWDAETGKLVRTLDGHTGEVRCALFTADGKKLVTGGRDNTVIVWDPETGKQLKSWRCDDTVHNLCLVPNQPNQMAVGHDRFSRYDLSSGEELVALRGDDHPVECLAISRDGTKAVTGSFGGEMRIWDLKAGKETARYQAHQGACWWVDFSPDGKFVVSGGGGGWTNGQPDPGEDFAIRIWKLDE